MVAAGRDRRELRRRAEHLGAADTALKTELTAARVLSYLAGVRAPAARVAPASSPIPL